MTILYLLIPVSLLFLAAGIGAFIWAVKNGQYDDMEGPAHRILMDDDDPRIPSAREQAQDDSEEGSGAEPK